MHEPSPSHNSVAALWGPLVPFIVAEANLSSWFLLLIISYVMVGAVNRPTANDDNSHFQS